MIADRLFDKTVTGCTARRLRISAVGAAMTEPSGAVKVFASAEGAPENKLFAATDYCDGRNARDFSHDGVPVEQVPTGSAECAMRRRGVDENRIGADRRMT